MRIDLSYKELKEKIQKSSNFLVIAHANPDADAIGSTLALSNFLSSIGKNVKALNADKVPDSLQFLNNNEIINDFGSGSIYENLDMVFILDCNDAKRTGRLSEELLKLDATKIVIDHHMFPKDFADFYIVDTDTGSTGELIYKVISEFDFEITERIATLLYAAIFTDHGGFRFDRTNANTFQIVSDLVNCGASPEKIYNQIYSSNSFESLKLYSRALSNIEIHEDGLLAIMPIREVDFRESGASEDDTEGLASVPLSIKGVKKSVTMIEYTGRNEIRCSFRSKEGYNIRLAAEIFGGGGHNYASGARIKNTLFEDLRIEIIEEVKKIKKSRS